MEDTPLKEADFQGVQEQGHFQEVIQWQLQELLT